MEHAAGPRGELNDQLLISMEVRDERGNLLLKIARNSPVHHAEGVDVDKKVKGAGLRRIVAKDATGNVILDVDVRSSSEIEVNGTFLVAGKKIIATKDGLDIGGMILSHCEMTDNGVGIAIG